MMLWTLPLLIMLGQSLSLLKWTHLALAHYVGCVTWLTLVGLPGTLPNITGRGFDHSIVCILSEW